MHPALQAPTDAIDDASAAMNPDEGYRGAQRFLVTGFSLYRFWAGTSFFLALFAKPGDYGSALAALVVLCAWAAWSVWLCSALARRGAYDATHLLVGDLLVLGLVWLASTLVHPPLPPVPEYVAGVGFCAVLGFGIRWRSVPISALAGVVLALGLIGSYVVAGVGLGAAAAAVAADSGVSMVALSIGAALLALQVVRTGRRLDVALGEGAASAQDLAERRERTRAARDLHDRVLQTLESVARSEGPATDEMRARTASDAAWMRGMLTRRLETTAPSAPAKPPEPRGSMAAERSAYHGFLLFRVATLAWPLLVVPLTLDAVARPVVIGTAALVCVVESAIVLRIGWQRGSWSDPRLALADLLVQTGLLAICIWHPETTGRVLVVPFVVPVIMGSMLGCGIAFRRARSVVLAGLGAGAVYLGLLAVRAPDIDLAVPLLNSVYWFLGYGLGGWILARQLREVGRQTDAARSEAIDSAVLAGEERERERLAEPLGKRALPTLERLASDDAAPAETRADARRASMWIQAYLQGATAEGTALLAALREAVEDAKADGLSVDLNVSGVWSESTEPLDSSTIRACQGAVREALKNVQRHSGTSHAVVRVAPGGDGGTVITVVDNGSGFDPASIEGLGIEHSIVQRIEEVGGAVEIDSAPGEGSRIVLLIPRKRGRV